MNEFEFIKTFLSPLSAKSEVAFSLTDDAAVLPNVAGKQWVVSKDLMAEGIHYLANMDPRIIAQRLLRVNLSDIAAMGASPRFYMLGLSLPEEVSEDWARAFCEGLNAAQKQFGVALIGGDTIKAGSTACFSLTIFGEIDEGRAVRRSGAKDGDEIYVSGTIGDSALGLKCLRGIIASDPCLVERYNLPTPRISLGERLAGTASAMIDVSDGLIADLKHIADASNVAARVKLETIPLSEAAKQVLSHDDSQMPSIYGGGDDYELLFTAPSTKRDKIVELANSCAVAITRIGEIKKGSGVTAIDKNGDDVTVLSDGYKHF